MCYQYLFSFSSYTLCTIARYTLIVFWDNSIKEASLSIILKDVLQSFGTCVRVRLGYFGTYKGQEVKRTVHYYFKRYTSGTLIVGREQFLMTDCCFVFSNYFLPMPNISKKDNILTKNLSR